MKVKTIEASYSEGFEQKSSVNYKSTGMSFHRSIKLTADLEPNDAEDGCVFELNKRAKAHVKKALKQDREEMESRQTVAESVQ